MRRVLLAAALVLAVVLALGLATAQEINVGRIFDEIQDTREREAFRSVWNAAQRRSARAGRTIRPAIPALRPGARGV
jgi:hypothetical protein